MHSYSVGTLPRACVIALVTYSCYPLQCRPQQARSQLWQRSPWPWLTPRLASLPNLSQPLPSVLTWQHPNQSLGDRPLTQPLLPPLQSMLHPITPPMTRTSPSRCTSHRSLGHLDRHTRSYTPSLSTSRLLLLTRMDFNSCFYRLTDSRCLFVVMQFLPLPSKSVASCRDFSGWLYFPRK